MKKSLIGFIALVLALGLVISCDDGGGSAGDDLGKLPSPPSGTKPDLTVPTTAAGIDDFPTTAGFTVSVTKDEADQFMTQLDGLIKSVFPNISTSTKSYIGNTQNARQVSRAASGSFSIDLSKKNDLTNFITKFFDDLGFPLKEEDLKEMKDDVDEMYEELEFLNIKGYASGKYNITDTDISATAESQFRFETKEMFEFDEEEIPEEIPIKAVIAIVAGEVSAKDVKIKLEDIFGDSDYGDGDYNPFLSGTVTASVNTALNLGLTNNRYAKCTISVSADSNLKAATGTVTLKITIFGTGGNSERTFTFTEKDLEDL